MRHINTTGLNPKKYKIAAQKKTTELKALNTIIAKHAYIENANNKIWNELKKVFEHLSHNKCWFTEAYAGISDYAIEHFRPKKRINLIRSFNDYPERRNATDTEGYWWLAYDFSNLRLAGFKPNQLKKNYFPLETNSPIATDSINIWEREIPLLLDPCVLDDTRLIRYDGVVPTEADLDVESLNHIRTKVSIHVYGLDRIPRLNKERSITYEHARSYHKNANSSWEQMLSYDDPDNPAFIYAYEMYESNCKNLICMLRPDKPFTKMIYDFLFALNTEWVERDIIEIARQKNYIEW